ncbi:MAG: patatin-like phospholipase family protein [Thermoanaerobaculia bacterium]|nr:patatin-like phospholipase family protein [Thermoanaerobaculia bacterium]
MSRTISLVLGSGGARGLAHIGVIRELEERDFEIRSVVGCSMGAVIGGCYAAGKLDDYESWVSELTDWDVVRLLDVSLIPEEGMMKGDHVIEALRELVGDHDIEDLPIPFTAVATDVIEHREIWLRQGSLFDAIRASIAIPGLFVPHQVGDRKLVDGGLLNPVPVAAATRDPTDVTIAVSLLGPDVDEPYGPDADRSEAPETTVDRYRRSIDRFIDDLQEKLGWESDEKREKQQQLGVTEVLLEALDAMQAAIVRFHLAAYPADILIEIPKNAGRMHEFDRAKPLIAAGRYWAKRALEERSDGDGRSARPGKGEHDGGGESSR